MLNKGLEAEINMDETPNLKVSDDRPLKDSNNQSKKVDINVLKARVQELQNKENKKKYFYFYFFFNSFSYIRDLPFCIIYL
jgi:hypothetical protein